MAHKCEDHHHHHDHDNTSPKTRGYFLVICFALLLNAAMFVVELFFGFEGESTALHADAVDFFADSINYILTLFVLDSALSVRAKVGMAKGYAMFIFGIIVLLYVVYRLSTGNVTPEPLIMGWVGFAALMANLLSALAIYLYRILEPRIYGKRMEEDSNMHSTWLCTRNDAIGNILIVISGVLIFYAQIPIIYLLLLTVVIVVVSMKFSRIKWWYLIISGCAAAGALLYYGAGALDVIVASYMAYMAIIAGLYSIKKAKGELAPSS